MGPNAYGPATFRGQDGKLYSNYSPGQGKGFPEATPLPSVGSVNRFARRAIKSYSWRIEFKCGMW